MKNIALIFFIFVLFIQIGLKLGVGVWFVANQTEIIDQFCVNKSNEDLQCNGKCHLNKQIALIENHSNEKEDNTNEQTNKLPTVVEYVETKTYSLTPLLHLPKERKKTPYPTVYYDCPYVSLDLAPPQHIA